MKQAAPHKIRQQAELLTNGLPPLLNDAKRLAASVALGVHGRRKAGQGDAFWQYRQATPGDNMASIDWRRSARTDAMFIREHEWEAAHTVSIWADTAQSMDFRGDINLPTKLERVQILALALSVLLSKAGERISFPGTSAENPRAGETQLQRITDVLTEIDDARPDYGIAPDFGVANSVNRILFSDFLGDEADVFPALEAAAALGTGCIVQVLDDSEENFPFDGRVIFQSMSGAINFETQRAKSLKKEYQDLLVERCGALENFAKTNGWQYLKHNTSHRPQSALLWLYMAIGEPQ